MLIRVECQLFCGKSVYAFEINLDYVVHSSRLSNFDFVRGPLTVNNFDRKLIFYKFSIAFCQFWGIPI